MLPNLHLSLHDVQLPLYFLRKLLRISFQVKRANGEPIAFSTQDPKKVYSYLASLTPLYATLTGTVKIAVFYCWLQLSFRRMNLTWTWKIKRVCPSLCFSSLSAQIWVISFMLGYHKSSSPQHSEAWTPMVEERAAVSHFPRRFYPEPNQRTTKIIFGVMERVLPRLGNPSPAKWAAPSDRDVKISRLNHAKFHVGTKARMVHESIFQHR